MLKVTGSSNRTKIYGIELLVIGNDAKFKLSSMYVCMYVYNERIMSRTKVRYYLLMGGAVFHVVRPSPTPI